MARCRFALLAFVALTLSGTAYAGAEAKDQSRSAFRRGVAKLKEEKFTEARDEFQEAYKLFPHPSILLNLGLARIRLSEWVEAEQDLTKFIADDGGATADEIQSARSWLGEARDHLGTLKLQVSPDKATVTLDKKPVTITPAALSSVRATAGMHQLHVDAEGFEAYDEFVTVVAKEELTRRVTLIPKKGEPVAAGGDEKPARSGLSGQQVGGIVLLGTSAAFLGAGIFCGISAASYADHYNRARVQDPAEKDTGILFRTLADVGFGAAIVSGVVGTYLLVSAPKQGAKKTVTASIGPSSIVLRGEF